MLSMAKRVYVMDGSRFSRLIKTCSLVCRKCGLLIHIGDLVLSNCANNRIKLYHKVCFESLYLHF